MDDIWKIRWFWICWAVSWPRESLNSVFGLFYCVMCRNNKLSAIWNRERSTSANIWKSLPLIRAATALAPCVPTTVIWYWKFHLEIFWENHVIPPVDLYLISEDSIWKNQVRQTGFLVYYELDFYCLCSLQKSISKLIFAGLKSSWSTSIFTAWFFQKSSTDQQGDRIWKDLFLKRHKS